ncbi:MAG TPA: zf-HC2 domain-containing protein [Pyrinomonadaceae bacterium]|nr:zf-HC2 domain-containing protein [Pyrinomonadaceae bacterium]
MNHVIGEKPCPMEDVAAYLDGELDGVAQGSFETHLASCGDCAAELLRQRQLLCTLDAAFTSSSRFDLPEDFTRVVAAHAESDLSGVRRKSERLRAIQMCAVLALAAFALLGATSSALVFQPIGGLAQLIARVFDLVWQTMYEAGLGVAIILRMLGRAAIASPYGLGMLLTLTFLIAASLLPRLIANYHRKQVIE